MGFGYRFAPYRACGDFKGWPEISNLKPPNEWGLGTTSRLTGPAVVLRVDPKKKKTKNATAALLIMLSTEWSYITTQPSEFYGWSGFIFI